MINKLTEITMCDGTRDEEGNPIYTTRQPNKEEIIAKINEIIDVVNEIEHKVNSPLNNLI